MGSTHNNNEPPNVLHFSHPHPLEYTRTSTSSTLSKNAITCFGCKLSFVQGEAYYRCKPCSYSLHHVCYKMPLITKHPSHPKHELVLLVIPSSPATKATLKCNACGNHVTGFCYHCAECSSIFFHTFCLALPLSITITRHPHRMELAFSPPYDFFCDLCNKTSFNGWLYRCSMCEFDTHVACAVENIEPQSVEHPSFPQSNALMRQLHGNKGLNASVGDGTSSMIMRLVMQQIGGGIRSAAVVGWDKKLNSPRRMHKAIGLGKTKLVELQEKSPSDFASYLEERTPLRDKLTPLSDTNTPSHHSSEAYFSIDLAKSYSAHDRKNQLVGKEIGISDQIMNRSVVVSEERIVSNSGQGKEPPFGVVTSNWPSNDGSENEAHQNKLNSAIFEGLGESKRKVVVRNSNESLAKWSIKDQTVTKSDSKRDNRSGWRKCLSCCL